MRVREIKKAFPDPKAYPGFPYTGSYQKRSRYKVSYCVGGAACLYAAGVIPTKRGFSGAQLNQHQHLLNSVCFPTVKYLTQVLMFENPRLSSTHAKALAFGIIYWNDIGDFKHAWEDLDEALKCLS